VLTINQLVETIKLVDETHIKHAEFVLGVSVKHRIKKLERATGVVFYPGHDYDRMSYLGREWLRNWREQ
jgi:hypothetical protein